MHFPKIAINYSENPELAVLTFMARVAVTLFVFCSLFELFALSSAAASCDHVTLLGVYARTFSLVRDLTTWYGDSPAVGALNAESQQK